MLRLFCTFPYSGLFSAAQIISSICKEPNKAVEIQTRFDRAKMAADTVKGSFTDCIAFYNKTLHEKEVYAERLLDEFQRAIDEKQFCVYFQPKYNIRSEKPVLCGAEALVRWIHPELGVISPGIFIPLFENNGLVRKLDFYVWRETVSQIAQWKKQYGSTVPVSVNVSRIDMLDPDLVETLWAL